MDIKEENEPLMENDESDTIGNRRSDIKHKAFRNAIRLSPRAKGLERKKTDSDDPNHSTNRSQRVRKRRYRKRNRVKTLGRPRKDQCFSSESEDEEISPKKRSFKIKRRGRVARKNTLAPFNDDVAPPTAQQVMDWANDKTLTIHMD